MKILIYNDYIFGGGAEKMLLNVAKCLNDEGHVVTVLTKDDGKEYFKNSYPNKIKYVSTYFMWRDGRRFSKVWFKHHIQLFAHRLKMYFIKRKKYDVAIAFKEGNCMRDVLEYNAKRKIGWIHVDYSDCYWTRAVFKSKEEELETMKAFNHIICVSNAVKDSIKHVIGDPGNLCVRYNPVDYKFIRAMSESLDKCEKKRVEKITFITVGRLVKQKGYMLLLETCKELQKKYDFDLWIIGDGIQRKELEMYIKEHNLTCVHLLGEKKNPYPYMKQADWYVSSSTAESYGLSIQEALILGIPVISTMCPAIVECLDSRYNIIVPNSFEGLYKGIEKILLSKELTIECKKKIESMYECEELWLPRLKLICDVYNGLIN